MWNKILPILRSSEFWATLAQVAIQAAAAPVPDEIKVFGWVYIVLRVASKMAKYVFPNPSNPAGGWLKNDGG